MHQQCRCAGIGDGGGNFSVNRAGQHAKIAVHASVINAQIQPVGAEKPIDCRIAAEKIKHHLPGDRLRVSTYPGVGDAVIGGGYQQGCLGQGRPERALDQADLQGERFELAKRAERFGFAADFGAQGGLQAVV